MVFILFYFIKFIEYIFYAMKFKKQLKTFKYLNKGFTNLKNFSNQNI
jgi:hypothetical protein